MTFVVIDNCHGCRFTDCVAVCPVECFYELEKQLVIDPDECIDCGMCVPECPVEAIYDEYEVPEEHLSAIQFNAEQWENGRHITETQYPLPGAEERRKALGFG